ncbi:hypothetical protein WDU94_009720 [Cyamophila willieti]
MKPIWSMETKYDLIVTELFMTDAFLVVPYLYNTPYISLSSAVLHPQHSERLGLPDNPSYIPSFVSAFTDKMSFVERFENTWIDLYTKWYFNYVSHSISNEIIQKMFPNKRIPRIQNLLNNCSLVLTNTHYTINSARPLPPNVVEIGGVHLKPPKKLNEDFEKFLNESEYGVIYFSMGSILRTSSLPPEKLNAFLNAFAKIPQRILWKIEDESILRKHKNIKAAAWMPQRDIFAHPNVKLFISHGGLLGITEAVNEGIPVLGIPVFADQWSNVKKLESLRAGKLLRYPDINEKAITEALKIVLSPEYKQNAKILQSRFQDRLDSPLEVAIYWIEYVIRLKGAPHLQPASVGLTWYQYYLLDVILTVLLSLVTICYSVKLFLQSLVTLVCYLTRGKKKTD